VITATNDQIVVDPSGLVRVCAWCVPLVRLMEIHRAHRCTDGICPDCRVKLEQETA
jgi:hypothetical protein